MIGTEDKVFPVPLPSNGRPSIHTLWVGPDSTSWLVTGAFGIGQDKTTDLVLCECRNGDVRRVPIAEFMSGFREVNTKR